MKPAERATMDIEIKAAAVAAMFEEAARRIRTELDTKAAMPLLKELQKGIEALESIPE